jgi:hypothetical protein
MLLQMVGLNILGLVFMDLTIIAVSLPVIINKNQKNLYIPIIFSYLLLGLFLIAINLIMMDKLDGITLIRYSTFFRRTVLPFLLVFVFVKLLKDENQIKKLNGFLFRLLMALAVIQTVDFILFQYEPYNQFIRYLISFTGTKLEHVNITVENYFARSFFGIEFHRSQGFMLDMYASNLFCIFLYSYLRIAGIRFKWWQKTISFIACISGLSLLFFISIFMLEFVLFFTGRPNKRVIETPTLRQIRKNRTISRVINLSPFIMFGGVITMYFLFKSSYAHEIFMLYFFEFSYILSGNIESIELGSNIQDYLGYGGLHLLDSYGDELYHYVLKDIAILGLIYEGGILNFLFLMFLLLYPIFLFEIKYRKLFEQNPFIYRIFLSSKFIIFLGITTWVHQLAIWSRQVVVLYMMGYSMIFITTTLVMKNNREKMNSTVQPQGR